MHAVTRAPGLRLGLSAVLLVVAACRSVPPTPPSLEAPTVRVGVGNLSESEQRRIERFFREEIPDDWALLYLDPIAPMDASLRGAAVDVQRDWVVRLSAWEDLEELHDRLTDLRDARKGHRILKNVRIDADLYYTSSDVDSSSEARITIRVSPPDAELVFDTEVPVVNTAAGEPVPTLDGEFTFRLPFAFIRRAERFFYFHSEYRGQYRYYRYDLETQSQELLEGVNDPAGFARYLEGLQR